MAVIFGGANGARVAWDAAADSAADRLLALQAQEGTVYAFTTSRGSVINRRVGADYAEINVGINVFSDGVVSSGNTLSSASAPFLRSMLGMQVELADRGRRRITTVTTASQVTFDGPATTNGSIHFTLPTGYSAFNDGVVSGNQLSSASAPFSASMVGRDLVIRGTGTRTITGFTSTSVITFDGAPVPDATQRIFNLPVFTAQREHAILAVGKVVDSHRVPALNTPTVVRWRIG
jgi:hypothetical protein